MDCVIPSHSVRPFCAAIGAMSRIGKELYVEFNVLEGLTLRTLNDAKSAFCSFQWEPSFFERCTAPPSSTNSNAHNSSTSTTTTNNHNSRKRPAASSRSIPSSTQDTGDTRFSCRVPLRALATVVRPRKGVQSLRVRHETSCDHMYLSFEFRILKDANHHHNSNSNSNNDSNATTTSGDTTLLRVVHRIGVADADGVAAVAPKDACSEIVAAPRTLLKMLEPLKGTTEIALIVDDTQKIVTATSFHHASTAAASTGNALLHASTVTLLKTETSIGCDEFFDFEFRDDRFEEGGATPQFTANTNVDIAPPDDVNQMVSLVFGIKEAKAMLHFCSQAHLQEELRVSISFHWGGKPILFETEAESFSAQLIMATLDHKLLGGIHPANTEREHVERHNGTGEQDE